MYDVVIVGAGPAGSTLARLIGRRHRVLLVDRRRLDIPFDRCGPGKPCGGLLAPAAQRELARQGLGVPGDVLSGPQLFGVRTIDLATRRDRLYQRFYMNVEREAFDRWLVSLVPPSVDTAFGWTLEEVARDEQGAFLDFYGWTIPKHDRILLGAAFPAAAGVGARFEALVARSRARGVRLGEELQRSSAMVLRPSSPLQLLPGADPVLLVGEAAGFISPSSAEGISYALRSAAALGDALAAGVSGAGARYRLAAAPIAAGVAMKVVKARTVYGSVFRGLALKTGVGAITELRRSAPVPSVLTR